MAAEVHATCTQLRTLPGSSGRSCAVLRVHRICRNEVSYVDLRIAGGFPFLHGNCMVLSFGNGLGIFVGSGSLTAYWAMVQCPVGQRRFRHALPPSSWLWTVESWERHRDMQMCCEMSCIF